MKITQPTLQKQEALAELTIYLRRIQIIRNLTDLDLLEVINSAGAGLLQQTLQDKALAMAAMPKANREDETAVIPRISTRRPDGKLSVVFPRTVGTETVDVAEYRDRMGDDD